MKTDLEKLVEEYEGRIPDDGLDDPVLDIYMGMAATTNNQGLFEQVQFLVTHLGMEETKSILKDALPEGA